MLVESGSGSSGSNDNSNDSNDNLIAKKAAQLAEESVFKSSKKTSTRKKNPSPDVSFDEIDTDQDDEDFTPVTRRSMSKASRRRGRKRNKPKQTTQPTAAVAKPAKRSRKRGGKKKKGGAKKKSGVKKGPALTFGQLKVIRKQLSSIASKLRR